MSVWDIGWAGHQHFTEFMSQDSDSERRKIGKNGGGSRAVHDRAPAPQVRQVLQLPRANLPRGRSNLTTQIGAELRSVYAAPILGELPGADDLLAQIDR